MSELEKELYKVLYRFHNGKPKFKGDGDLANIEFFMLIELAAMLVVRNAKCCGASEDGKTEEKTGVTLKEMIEANGMTMSAASKKISILENKGYVMRTPSKTDRRNVEITLTEKGKEVCEREKEKKQQFIKALIDGMGEEDMNTLIALANKAFDVMDKISAEQENADGN